jgi:hypothetical protein
MHSSGPGASCYPNFCPILQLRKIEVVELRNESVLTPSFHRLLIEETATDGCYSGLCQGLQEVLKQDKAQLLARFAFPQIQSETITCA